MNCEIFYLNDDNADSFEEQTELDYYEVAEEAEQLFKRSSVNLMLRESIYTVCINGDKVEGALSLHTLGMNSITGNIAVSFSVAVEPDTRRQGIARALLKRALEDFPSDQFDIEVRVINPNIVALLTQMGFLPLDGGQWSPTTPTMFRP